jgi:hypothetical protein
MRYSGKMLSTWMLLRVGLVRTDVSGTYNLHHQGDIFILSVIRLLGIASVFLTSLILVALMMEALRSSET